MDKSENNEGDLAELSPSQKGAALIRQHQEEIARRWLAEVLAHIPPAREHGEAEVTDHLLFLLNDIVRSLDELGDSLDPARVSKLRFVANSSTQHGRERASLDGFTAGHLMQEYILLRQIISGYCNRLHPDDPHTIDIINRTVEKAALHSVNEFVRALQEIQQKLIGTLVHDVRTPLGVAHNYVELLSQAAIPEDQRQQVVSTVTRNLRRAMVMLEELLDTTALRAGAGLLLHFEEADLNADLRTVCQEMNLVYETEILFEAPGRPTAGVFDIAMVVRAVENLVSNAVKFGYRQRPIHVRLLDLGEHVQLTVHNEGEPIASEQRDSIFRFFSSGTGLRMGKRKAWGLGLALIKTVAEQHGGRVLLESSAAEGTTLGMELCKHHRRAGEEVTVLLQ